jgi:hypothetical protein
MMKPVNVGLVACGESFRATIWVREEEYFSDGKLLETKLRNRLSCNMSVVFLKSQPTEETR